MSISIVVFGVIGALTGSAFLQTEGLLIGLVLGLLLGWTKNLSERIAAVEKRMAADGSLPRDAKQAGSDAAAYCRAQSEAADNDAIEPPKLEGISDSAQLPSRCRGDSRIARPAAAASSNRPEMRDRIIPGESPSHPGIFVRLSTLVRDFFTHGNIVVRIGLIVLFFGVAFLIKYAAQRQLMPIELRLAAVAMGGVAMLFFGWRLRNRKANYALTIQGGGIGILYLTIYGAASLYDLLPPGLAFALMIGMVALSAALALLQDALPLAAFGAIGGFMAPVLISTGTGSHVALFSYYALINTGIVGIAWFKSWRVLNWIGFMFTFVIGTAWGYRFYRPEFFGSTEPFLILFFLFYVAIAILFAHRQPVHLKGYIDGSLIFGLPIAAFALQSALVSDTPYGMAASALVLGGFYILLASGLWRRQVDGMRLLTESFLCLGVAFASIAIPLGLDSSWTTGLWCFEGAGLVWIGVRQHRVLARTAGLLLQLGAGAAFINASGASADSLPVVNATYMSCLIISLSAFISNYCHQRYQDRLKRWEKPVHFGLLVWALFWFFGGGLHEIDRCLGYPHDVFAAVSFIAASGWLAGWFSRRFQWADIGYPAMAAAPVTAGIAWLLFAGRPAHPFASWGGAAWGVALVSGYHLLYRFDRKWPNPVVRGLHLVLLFLVIFILSWEFSWVIGRLVNGTNTWAFAAWAFLPALMVMALLRYGARLSWPVMRFKPLYLDEGLIPVTLFLWGWLIVACFRAADPAPLSYLPLVNPVEIVQAFVFFTLIRWWTASDQRLTKIKTELPPHSMAALMLATTLLWLSSVIARTVHFKTGINFSGPALFASVHFQSALSIAWTITALAVMAAATHKKSRIPWFIGAALLAIVVAKLFLIDLDSIGTVARIVSFMAVGILMLVIGYVSPLPPKRLEGAI